MKCSIGQSTGATAAFGVRRSRLTQLAARVLLGGALMSPAGCGGGQLDQSFEDEWQLRDGSEPRRVAALLAGKKGLKDIPVAIGVTGRGLVGRVLPQGARWAYEGALDVAPSISGNAVAFTGEGRLTVLDLASGAKLFSKDVSGRRLEGFGTDGTSFAFLLVDSDDARPDLLLITSSRGDELTSSTTTARVGTPAVVDGIGLVPFARQYVGAFDVKTGAPLGRLLVRDSVHTVRASERGVWVLGKGAHHLDERLAGNLGSDALALSLPELPGEPSWPRDGSKPRQARARPVSIDALPMLDGKTPHFAGDAYAYSYFDLVLGFDAKAGRLRWVTSFSRAVTGSDASETGVTVCLEDGTLHHLRWSDGAALPSGALDSRIRACEVRALGVEVTMPAREPLEAQIKSAASSTGPDMAAVQLLLLDELARRQGATGTEALLAVAQDPLSAPVVVERAGELLRKRTDGIDAMLAALEAFAPRPLPAPGEKPPGHAPGEPGSANETTHASDPGREGRGGLRRPPLEPLAEALTRAGEKRGAPLLARYLHEPAMQGAQSLALVHAVAFLGGPAEVPALRSFYETYKNTGGDAEFIAALGMAAEFLVQHGNADDRALVAKSRSDELTHPDLREQLQHLDLDAAEESEQKRRAGTSTPGASKDSGKPGAAGAAPGSTTPERKTPSPKTP